MAIVVPLHAWRVPAVGDVFVAIVCRANAVSPNLSNAGFLSFARRRFNLSDIKITRYELAVSLMLVFR